MTATLEPTATVKGAKAPAASPADVIRKAHEAGVQVVDVRFCDLPGTWQHFSIPLKELSEDVFSEGLGFDGSSIRGFQAINESDMLLFPDPATAFVDPCLQVPTLALICDVADPVTGAGYSRDPRYVARKAEEFLVKSGIATTAYFGPEAEFYIFNSVRFDQNAHEGYYHIDSEEGIWNSGTNGSPNLGHRPRHKEGYFPVPPVDRLQDLRSKIMLALIASGVDDDEQLSPSGAGLRGADQPDLLAAQPLGDLPHPGVLDLAEGEAGRVPGAGSVEQPVSDVRGAAHGRPRRCEEQDRAAEADGRRSVRAGAGGAQAREEHAGKLGRVAGRAGSGPRLPAPGRRVHAGPDRDVAVVQARQGRGSGAPAAASVRVLPVLRRVTERTEEDGERRRKSEEVVAFSDLLRPPPTSPVLAPSPALDRCLQSATSSTSPRKRACRS